jgi:holo-[acyl-carrier protein] synthase
MIVGIGVDLVDMNRFEHRVNKTPGLIEKIFREDERDVAARTLAGRFAAKEALVKAFGGSNGMHWHDVKISKNELGAPLISLFGSTAEVATQKGIANIHLSISHDGDYAMAYVIAESN